MNTYTIPTFWLFRIVLLWTGAQVNSFEQLFSIILGEYLEVGMRDYMAIVFKGTNKLFSSMTE